ncbi:MAG: undecaprenyldiphospho-muramoylpentapeptide beta-N-acetylglucosaminyltransferase [Elusimicrobia bacterium]|nr:undecaprenyldiphospho-muramoylpentapeptide beta-N-acetylglucosaminyltransferase [Elusimicrobiota bacterium]
MAKKILIAVSSTGGHIYPGLAIASEFKKKGYDVFFIGKKTEIITRENYRFYTISSIGFQRKISIKAIIFIIKNIYSVFQSIKILIKEKPDIVIGFGGYVSFPVVFAAWIKKIPTIIHEQNIIPGLANKLSSKFASKVCISFGDSSRYFPLEKVVFTGNPVRQDILDVSKQTKSIKIIKLPITILVFGGSQGSKNINLAAINSLSRLVAIKEKIRFIHITGENNYEIVKNAYSEKKIPAEVYKYLFNIETAYQKASLVICRAGATTVAELITLKIPAVLIPYPYSTEEHQKANAEYLVRYGSAIIIEEKNIDRLAEKIYEFANNPDILQEMSESFSKISYPDPIKKFSELIENI